MAAIQIVAMAIALGAAGVEGAAHANSLHCPKNYCLNRIAAGTGADAYSCEQYPEVGRQCGFENDPRLCSCVGKVKYGNFIQSSGPAAWTVEKDIAGKTNCSNDVFGDPVNGAKYCVCTPTKSVAGARDTKPAVLASSAKAGNEAPKCIMAAVSMKSVLPAASMYAMGANEGLPSMFIRHGLEQICKSELSGAVAWDKDTFALTVRIPCNPLLCHGSPEQGLDALTPLRTDTKPLIDITTAFIAKYATQLGPMSAQLAAAGLDFEVQPKEWPTKAGTTKAPAGTGATKASTTKAPKAAAEETTSGVEATSRIGVVTAIAVATGIHAWFQ